MLTQSFRFVSLVFTALILGGAFCHVLEMPLKLAMAGAGRSSSPWSARLRWSQRCWSGRPS